MADEITKSFECLPIDQLICAPIVAVAEGQAELCRVYLDTLFRLAFKDKEHKEINSIDFNLQRMIVGESGEAKTQDITVSAPLLSLVPVPAFTMDEATVRFTMEIKEINTQKKRFFFGSQYRSRFQQVGLPREHFRQSHRVIQQYPHI